MQQIINIDLLKTKKFLDSVEASQYMLGMFNIKLSPTSIRRLCRLKAIKSIKPGKSRAIKPEWLNQYLDNAD